MLSMGIKDTPLQGTQQPWQLEIIEELILLIGG